MLPREREIQRETFFLEARHGPRCIRNRGAFDKICCGTRVQIGLQLFDRTQREARPGTEVDALDALKLGQHHLGRRLRRRDQAPHAPNTLVPCAESHIGPIRQSALEGFEILFRDLGIHVDHHRAPRLGPKARNLFCAIKSGMDQQKDADTHAQLPLLIRPRISSWRQLIYFSEPSHQRSGWSRSVWA